MKFSNWTLDSLIEYLKFIKSAPADRLDYYCVPMVSGEIFVVNGERIDETDDQEDMWS